MRKINYKIGKNLKVSMDKKIKIVNKREDRD